MKATARRLISVCLGNLFEHYDTALFGLLSPFLAQIIFPGEDPVLALLLTYLIIPLGMVARPFGAFIIGGIGDRLGREKALFLSLTGMGIVSVFMACIPTFGRPCILVPILFCLGRLIQNIFAAGETMGGGIHLLENLPKERHDVYSAFYAATSIGGYLLASLGVYTVASYGSVEFRWRYLYLFGAITALFGASMRKTDKSSSIRNRAGSLQVLWEHSFLIMVIAITSGFSYATYSMAMVLMNGFIPLISTISKSELMRINTYLLVFDFCILPVFGWIASKVDRDRYLLVTCLAALSICFPLLSVLKGATLFEVILVRGVFVVFGVAFFAPFQAWVHALVPENCRYRVISMGYALGAQLIGSPTAALSLWCYKVTGVVSSIGWYWAFVGFCCVAALSLVKNSKRGELLT